MLSIRVDTSSDRSRVRTIRNAVASAKPQILNDCGSRLEGLAKLYFDNLANGGSTFDGRRWPVRVPPPLKTSGAARRGLLRGPVSMQGVLTGALIQSLRSTVDRDRVRLSYEAADANYFTHNRPLLPAGFPAQWRQQCNGIVRQDLNKIQ